MSAKLESFVVRRLCSRPGPLAYLATYASWIIGFFFAFLGFLPDIHTTLIYRYDVLGSPLVWGILLLSGSTAILFGLYTKHVKWVKYGAMVNFTMWIFAGVLYLRHDHWYAFVAVALFHLGAQAHFYLSAAFDTLWEK